MLTYFRRNAGHKAVSDQMLAPISAVRGYWEALRVGGGVPSRDQLDPRGMASSLEKTFLIERIAPGQARFRLAGMHLADLLGMDARGMPLSALFEPVARTRLHAEIDQVFDQPSILEIWLEAERGGGRPALSGKMILMPVKGSKGEASLALGCIVTEGAVGRQPRRFAISGMVREVLPVPTLRVVDDYLPQPMPAPPRVAGRPALRLVSCND